MHGMYKIKVVKMTDGVELFNYAACTHPVKGGRIYLESKPFLVAHVEHILRTGRDGGGEYHSLDHVKVTVSK